MGLRTCDSMLNNLKPTWSQRGLGVRGTVLSSASCVFLARLVLFLASSNREVFDSSSALLSCGLRVVAAFLLYRDESGPTTKTLSFRMSFLTLLLVLPWVSSRF